MKRVKDIFAKICLFLFGTFGCMIFGAVIVYWVAGGIYLMVYSGEQVDRKAAANRLESLHASLVFFRQRSGAFVFLPIRRSRKDTDHRRSGGCATKRLNVTLQKLTYYATRPTAFPLISTLSLIL